MAAPDFTRIFSNSELLSTGMKSTMLVLLLSLLVGCGGKIPDAATSVRIPIDGDPPPIATPTPSPNPYFSPSMIGQIWTFVNGYGDHTVIKIEAAPAGSAAQAVWHYLPKPLNPDGTVNCRPYWNPGDCSAELLFGISENPDSSWSATQFLVTCDICLGSSTQGSATIKSTPIGGYLVIPPPQANFTTGNVGYVPCWQLGTLSWVPDNCNPAGATAVPWVTNGYMDNISTPVYSGPVLVSEQFEHCPDVCAHEKWYFAPNIGLVQVTQLQNGTTIDDPLLQIQRINSGSNQ